MDKDMDLNKLADGIEKEANIALDKALDAAARIYDPVRGMCGMWSDIGGNFAIVAILRDRAAKEQPGIRHD